mmetsp:Transcript_98292/g.316747  ORF Transcript_98292/g.316747 Transcript_98292/m.316747 type:complete len:92 (-) Transcript_98292:442-717(-)
MWLKICCPLCAELVPALVEDAGLSAKVSAHTAMNLDEVQAIQVRALRVHRRPPPAMRNVKLGTSEACRRCSSWRQRFAPADTRADRAGCAE